mmetsp:Transcript_71474/g.155251  ORF Transcript_71474/g.155251 Transcript_71474/m.155251 type:complete len:198 (+) Transcript_71474:85-678(+)
MFEGPSGGFVPPGRRRPAAADLQLQHLHGSAGREQLDGRSRSLEIVARSAAKRAPASKAIKDGDTVLLKGHSGNYLNSDNVVDDVKARAAIKAPRAMWTIEKAGGGAISAGDVVHLRGYTGGYIDIQGDMVRVRRADRSRCKGVMITKGEAAGPVNEGDCVYLCGGERRTYVDVEEQDVRARWPDEGKWQALIIEKE